MKERDKQHHNEGESKQHLIQFPFPLPERFLDQIEYGGPDQLVGLYWGAGDELAVYDTRSESAGLHNHYPWLELMGQPQVYGWRIEHEINFGSSYELPTHHMIVWKDRNEGYIAKVRQARRIAREQRLQPEDFS